MKTCPQCHKECTDEAVICPTCGYLFNASQPSGGEQFPPYQQQNSNAGGTPPYGNGSPVEQPKDGFATPAMVLGIIGVVFAFCIIGVVPAIIGLILGIIAVVRIRRTGARGNGMAIAGVVLSAVAIVIVTIAIIRAIIVVGSPDFYNAFTREYRSALEQSQSSDV